MTLMIEIFYDPIIGDYLLDVWYLERPSILLSQTIVPITYGQWRAHTFLF